MSATTNPSTVRKIWNLLTPAERRGAVLLLGLMFVGMALETLGVGLVIPAFALLTQADIARNYPALQPALQWLGNPSRQNLIIGGMLVLVGVYLIKALFLAFLTWRQMSFAFGVRVRLSQRLFAIYLRQPYTFHLQRNSAQLIQNVVNEVRLFTTTGIVQVITLLTESLVLLGLCILLLAIEPLAPLVVAGVLGAFAWGFHRVIRARVLRWGEKRQYHEGMLVQHLQQGFGGVKDVKLLARETAFLEQYRTHDVQNARVGQLNSTVQQLPRLWLEVLTVSGLAILIISILMQGRDVGTVLPTLALFAAAAFRLIPSVNRTLAALQALRYVLPGINTLYAEFTLPAPEVTSSRALVAPFRSALELSHVTYSYPGAAGPALRDISLTIRHGESVGFIGTSGAGKSTLVDILLGLLRPDVGKVLMDGQDIETNLRNLQDQVGYVPQSIFLTDDTLRRNVAFGLPDEQIDDVAVQRAIKSAQLEEFVDSLPNRLETVVGERGIRLSGGQRQRIGIARALYHDPALLVLDEATSSLDIATERGVIEAVRVLQETKTTIVVAHRLSTVQYCDRLYRLELGRLVEEGTPQTLLTSRARA